MTPLKGKGSPASAGFPARRRAFLLVDEQAQADALRHGVFAGAGVDILGSEPPREANPLPAPHPSNLIPTPHTAWASRESRQRLLEEVAENIRAFATGAWRNRLL